MSRKPVSDGAAAAGRRAVPTDRAVMIIEAAKALWAAQGFDGTSVDEIGAAAGVTGPAIYRYFNGKYALLAAALRDHLEENNRDLAYSGATAAQTLEWLVSRHIANCVDKTVLMSIYVRESARLPEPERSQYHEGERRYMHKYLSLYSELNPGTGEAQVRAVISAAIAVMNTPLYIRQTLPAGELKDILKDLTMKLLGITSQ